MRSRKQTSTATKIDITSIISRYLITEDMNDLTKLFLLFVHLVPFGPSE